MSGQPPYLAAEALAALGLSTAEMTDAIARAIRDRARGAVHAAPKAGVHCPDGRYLMSTLAASDDPPVVVVKTVVQNPANPGKGLALVDGLVTVLDAGSGRPLALLDGPWITGVRTAAMSLLAARHLARRDADVLAVIGAGVQARSHLDAFAAAFALRAVRIFGRGPENIARLARLAEARGLAVTVCDTGAAALDGAGLVASTISRAPAPEPFLDPDRLAAGAFVAMADLGAPWRKAGLAALDLVVVDDVAQEATMPDPLAPAEVIAGDLPGLVTGALAGRVSADQRTAFLFRGHAIGDLALAALVCRRAGLV